MFNFKFIQNWIGYSDFIKTFNTLLRAVLNCCRKFEDIRFNILEDMTLKSPGMYHYLLSFIFLENNSIVIFQAILMNRFYPTSHQLKQFWGRWKSPKPSTVASKCSVLHITVSPCLLPCTMFIYFAGYHIPSNLANSQFVSWIRCHGFFAPFRYVHLTACELDPDVISGKYVDKSMRGRESIVDTWHFPWISPENCKRLNMAN